MMNNSVNKIAVILTFAGITLLASLAHAAPDGGQVSAGSGAIAQAGTATTITQHSQNLAIDWNTFSIAANESVRFNQPNASSIALNRVLSNSPSQIFGNLSANGQVFVLNPNGVLFGKGAQVNVGGLVASTLSLSNADFMAGKYAFNAQGQRGSVVNQGTLTAAERGYVALLAAEARNEGVITATLGTALLAAGNKITLNIHNGSLLSYSIEQGALNALAENSQLIQANGGQVFMSAIAADALSKAVVNNTGIIEARTVQNKSGVIKLLGDMQTGTVNVGGTLDASAPNGGNGGFIDTSAAHVKVANDARITTQAARGISGNWLIDPTDYSIAFSGGDITGAALSANLNSTSITIRSTDGTNNGNGDIFVNDAVIWNSTHTLTLNAIRHINVNQPITNSGTGSVTLRADMNATCITGAAASACGTVTFSGTGHVTAATTNIYYNPAGSNGATPTYATPTSYAANVTGSLNAAMLVNDATQLQKMNTKLAGSYALGKDIPNAPGFIPVGSSASPFTGNFDGLSRTISNLTVNLPSTSYVGLFGYTATGSTIKNVSLLGGSMTGSTHVGGLVGYNNGTLSNVHTVNSVNGTASVGGLAGYNSGTISGSDASGSVSGGSETGGLVGYNSGTISSSYASGNVVGTSNAIGGLVGFNNGIINSNSSASGSVSGVQYVGGLVGTNYGTINTTYAVGSVSGQISVGGLVGYNVAGTITKSYATGNVTGSGGGSGIGGLVGQNSSLAANAISLSYATGSVIGNIYVGGLAGINYGVITKSYATGSVNGSTFVGGLVGYNTFTISYTYSTGLVSGGSTGGLAGYSSTAITSSYWDITTSGQAVSAGGAGVVGLSTTDMKKRSSFAGWNIANDTTRLSGAEWRIYDGGTYPLLITYLAPLTVTVYNDTHIYNGVAYAGGAGTDAHGLTGIYTDKIVYGGTSAGITDVYDINGDINVGTITVSGLYSNQQGYDIVGYFDGTMTMKKATVTVTANAASKTYEGLVYGGVYSVSYSGLVAGDESLLGGTLTYGGSSQSATNAGTYSITPSGLVFSPPSSNYEETIIYQDGTLIINRAPLTVKADDASKTFGQLISLTGWSITGGALQNGETIDSVALASLGAAATAGVASSPYAITANSASGSNGFNLANYDIIYAPGTLTVNKAPLEITANSRSKAYGQVVTFTGAEWTFTNGTSLKNTDAISSVGLTSAGAFANAGVAGGPYDIIANNASGTFDPANYNIIYVKGTLTVTPVALTVTPRPSGKVVGDLDPSPLTTVSFSGFVPGEDFNVLGGSLLLTRDWGETGGTSHNIYASGYTSSNYTVTHATCTACFTISPIGELLIMMASRSEIYGVDPASLVFAPTYAKYNNGSSVINLFDGVPPLTNNITLNDGTTFIASTDYTLGGNVGGSYAINAASVTPSSSSTFTSIVTRSGALAVTPRAVTWAPPSKVYDGNTALDVSTIVITNKVGSDVLGLTGSVAYADKNAATGKIYTSSDLTLTGAASGNYYLAPLIADGIITPKSLTITPDDASKVYGQVATLTAYTSSGLVTGETIGGVSLTSAGTAAAAGVASIPYAITASAAANSATFNAANYAITYTPGKLLTVTPAPLTVTANPDSKTYDGLAYTGGNGVTYTGFVLGQSQSTTGVLSGSLAYGGVGDTAQGKINAGSYLIMPFGLTAANYNISYAPGTLTIDPKLLTITAGNASKTYGQTATLTAYTSDGLVAGETLGGVSLSSAGTVATAGVAGGPYDIIVSGASGGTFNASNYDINYVKGALTVNRAALSVTANNASKAYGQTTNFTGSEFTADGLQNGEAIGSVSLISTGAAAGADLAGNPYSIQASGATGGSFDAANYDINYVDGTLTVNPTNAAAIALGSNKLASAYDTAQQGIAHTAVHVLGSPEKINELKGIAHTAVHVLGSPEKINELISLVNCGVTMPADAPANACQN